MSADTIATPAAENSTRRERFQPSPAATGPFGIYFGWYNSALALLSIMLVIGTTSYSFGLFVKPASAELGLSRASTNLGLILFHVGSAVANPLIGRLLDRVSIRLLYRICALLFAFGLVGVALSTSPLAIALCIVGPVAFGTVGAGSLFGVVLVSRWFTDRRGRAISIMAFGTSLGGMLVFPLIAVLMQFLGWRGALIAAGLGFGALLLLMSLLIGVRPDAQTAQQLADRAPVREGPSLPPRAILRERDFWLIAIPVALLLGIDQTMLATITPYMLDRGMSVTAAASIMSATTASAIAGKVLIAAIADRADLRIMLAVTAAFGIVLCLTLIAEPAYGGILAVSLLTGLAIGGTFPLSSAIMAQRFGAPSVGTAIGMMAPIISVSATSALYFIGAVHDRTNSYALAFGVFAGVALLAMILLPLVRRQPPPAA